MILIFPILLLPFNISAFANYNLIDPNLTTWDNLYPDTTIVSNFSSNPDIYRVLFKPELSESTQLNIRIGAIYSLEDLTTGNTYSFNFKIEDYNTINSIAPQAESYFYGFQRYEGGLVIGLASYNYDLDIIEPVTDCYVQINKDNYKSFFGKDTTINFELGNVTNPCLFIYYADANVGGNPVPFYFSNVSLIDNDAEKEDNFFSRLFEWFENKFKQLFNVLLYLDPDGEEDYNNPFAPNDTDVNGADNLEHLQNGINKFVESVENLTLYLRVPSEMLTTLGNRFPIIPIIVVFTLVGLVVMRLFGVRRDS